MNNLFYKIPVISYVSIFKHNDDMPIFDCLPPLQSLSDSCVMSGRTNIIRQVGLLSYNGGEGFEYECSLKPI